MYAIIKYGRIWRISSKPHPRYKSVNVGSGEGYVVGDKISRYKDGRRLSDAQLLADGMVDQRGYWHRADAQRIEEIQITVLGVSAPNGYVAGPDPRSLKKTDKEVKDGGN